MIGNVIREFILQKREMRETDLMRHPAALALIRYPNQISLSNWLFIDFCSDALYIASLCARLNIFS